LLGLLAPVLRPETDPRPRVHITKDPGVP